MPGKNEREELIVEIGNLKKDLNIAFKKRRSLIHPEVMAISMLLDEKMVQYMKMEKDKNPENDEIKETVMIYSIFRKADVRADKKKCFVFC